MKQTLRLCAIGISVVAMLFGPAACGGAESNEIITIQRADCGNLQGLAIPASAIGLPTSGAIIQTAAPVAEKARGNVNGEYCKVTGIIKPVNSASPNIEFEVNLPAKWNRRALQVGGGGYDGSLVTGLDSVPLQPASVENPLKQGYVTLGSDGGHKGGAGFDGRFGLDDEALLNYGKQSIKKTHDAAVAVIRKAYGCAPDRFYFIGGSQGGHEALDAAARYPENYDGVAAHFPAYNVTMLHLASLNVGRALYANGGAGWINAAKTKRITDAVYAACDKLDGAQDGIISNVEGCNAAFDIKGLRCPGGADSGDACLSDAQLDAVRKITSEYKPGFKIAGMDKFPRWPLLEGALFQVSTFGASPSAKDALLYSVGDQTVKFIIARNPNQDPLTFDEKQWKDRITTVASIMDVSNVSLDKFRAKGGKIILTHGTTDDFITPHNSEAYYERQVREFTRPVVNKFLRFYMIPGFGHGFGSFNAKFDSLQVLQNWVEKGQEPAHLTVTDGNTNANRSRPLCTWPAWPIFTGAPGAENDAASYRCALYVNRP
jgi:pimeloyl-ACP methyl ester carboxylesterase